MAKRWVVKYGEEVGGLGIETTSGFEPANMLCEAKDDWTVYNISWDHQKEIVFYDPEKQMRLEQAAIAEEKRKQREVIKVNFIRQLTFWQDAFTVKRFSWIELAAGMLSSILLTQLLFHFILGSR